MSRTSRLFLLLDALRAHRRPITAARIASDLGVSARTVYRDIQTLVELGAPIEGEAGMGYLLRTGFFLPPLMFSADELDALVLGARWVQKEGDATLATAAGTALAKIATASPKDLRDTIAETGLFAPRMGQQAPAPTPVSLQPIREAIRREQKVEIQYVNEAGTATARVIWPIALAYMERMRMLAAWCELRKGFRHFRADRITALTALRQRYPTRRADLVQQWRKEMALKPKRS